MLIWIPSLQENHRFKNITNRFILNISRNVNNKNIFEFIISIKEMLQELCVEESEYPYTIFDAFVVLLVMRISCINPIISLHIDDAVREVEISEWVEKIRFLDRNFKRELTGLSVGNEITVEIDVPLLNTMIRFKEYEQRFSQEELNSLSRKVDSHYVDEILLFISKISGHGRCLELKDYSYDDRVELFRRLPNSLVENVKVEVKKIIKEFNVFLMKLNGEDFTLNIMNSMDVARILFCDQSTDRMWVDIFTICKEMNMNSETILDMTPEDRNIMMGLIDEYRKASNKEEKKGSFNMGSAEGDALVSKSIQ